MTANYHKITGYKQKLEKRRRFLENCIFICDYSGEFPDDASILGFDSSKSFTACKQELEKRREFLDDCISICDYLVLYAHENEDSFPESSIALRTNPTDDAIKEVFPNIFTKNLSSIFHDTVFSKKICIFE